MTNLNSIKNILYSVNWQEDHGLVLDMINDHLPAYRSKFYDDVFKESVRHKDCVEIGFGAGLLSMLALKHGANHIDAWERDPCNYQIGQYIINQLGLQDRIALHQGSFSADHIVPDNTIIFHEIIGSNIWDENMRACLNHRSNTIIPESVGVSIDVLEFAHSDWEKLLAHSNTFEHHVEYPQGYAELLQNMIAATPRKIANRTFWQQQHIPNTLLAQLDFYNINLNNLDEIPESITKTFTLPKTNSCLLLYPHSTIAHNSHTLDWTWIDPLYVAPTSSNHIQITQDFVTGRFFYSLLA